MKLIGLGHIHLFLDMKGAHTEADVDTLAQLTLNCKNSTNSNVMLFRYNSKNSWQREKK